MGEHELTDDLFQRYKYGMDYLNEHLMMQGILCARTDTMTNIGHLVKDKHQQQNYVIILIDVK